MKYDIVKEFKDYLKNRFTNDSLAFMYKNLFDLFTNEELKAKLEYWMTQYEEHKSEWFFYFHKSIRQTDFFYNVSVYRSEDRLTDEQRTRRKQLLNKRHKMIEDLCPNDTDEEHKALKENVEWKTEGKELQGLNSLLNHEERISGGIFDSMLWELIHLDSKNELQSAFEYCFKICAK